MYCFNRLVTLVLLRALAAEDFHVDDRAFDAWRAIERSIPDVAGLFAEDRTEQLFFRRKRGFSLRRHFADENVAGLHRRADANYAAFVEVAKETLIDIGNIASHFLGAQLRVECLDFVFLDVD